MPNRTTPRPDATLFDLATKIGPAWRAVCVADDGPARARAGRNAQRRVDALMGEFNALFDALLAMRPTTPEGRKAQAEAIAPHYQMAGGQSDRVAAAAFTALGVDLMALAGFAAFDAQAA
jgi:hypothetical protein